jgi:hypothetical protein
MRVETFGLGHFAQARAFCAKAVLTKEARIRDFHAIGDDKAVFRTLL